MQSKPIFYFDLGTDLGIDTVPVNSLVHIKDVSGEPRQVLKVQQGTLDGASTILDFLGTSANFEEIEGGSALAVVSDTSLVTNSTQVTNIITIQQADYDSLGSYEAGYVYIII